MKISMQSIIILVLGYLLKDRGRFALTSSLRGQRSNVSLKVAHKKHTQVVKLRLIWDGEIKTISAKCLPISPSLNLTRVMTNSSSSFKLFSVLVSSSRMFDISLFSLYSYPSISIFLLLAVIIPTAFADNLEKEPSIKPN